MTRPSVIVIGAGIAGLTAAWHLHRAGHPVTVLEAAPHIGGRVGELERDGIRYNTGARLFYTFSKPFNRMLDALDLTRELVPVRGLGASVEGVDGHWRVELMPGMATLLDPGLTMADRARFVLYGLRMLAALGRANPDDATSLPAADAETLADHIRRHLGQTVLDRLVSPVFRGTRSQDPAEISATFFATTTPHMLGRKTVHVLKRGMNALPEALARDLHVEVGTAVRAVEPQGRGWRVTAIRDGQEITHDADLIVCAIEGDLAAPLFSTLPEADRAFLASIRYNALGIVHYRLNRQVAPDMRFFAKGAAATISTWQQIPGNDAKGTAPQLYVQLSPEAVRQVAAEGAQEAMHELVAPDLAALYPTLAQDRAAHVNQWIARKLPVFSPGHARAIMAFRARQPARGGLYFCGDYLNQPLVTGAAASGQAAAEAIIQRTSS